MSHGFKRWEKYVLLLINMQRTIIPNYDVTKTIVSPFMALLEVRMIIEWTNYGKHQNDNLRSLSYKALASLWWGRKYLNPSSFFCKHWPNFMHHFHLPIGRCTSYWHQWSVVVMKTLYHQLTSPYKRGQKPTLTLTLLTLS